jgi:hypothetical protein
VPTEVLKGGRKSHLGVEPVTHGRNPTMNNFSKHVSMATFVIFSTVVVVGLGARLAGI